MADRTAAERVGPYTILEKIAAGGMGTVYLAAHEREHGFRKLVALKRLHPHLEVGDEIKQRFAVEARIGASLAHPNIVSVIDLDTDADGELFFVMEYVQGCSLRAVTRTGSAPLAPRLAAFIVHELARALHAAHTFVDPAGKPWPVIHRDVNPKNVLLSESGAIKLTDFGIAKIFDQQLTMASGLRGTIDYMSPEQANGQTIDARTDVYSCGLILYELLVGRRAIQGEGQLERLARAREGVPVGRAALAAAGVPAPLIALLAAALARDPADRLPSAAALLERLEGYLVEAGYPPVQAVAALAAPHIERREAPAEPTRPTATAGPRPDPASAPPPRRGLILGVALALIAAAAAALALTWSLSNDAPTAGGGAADAAPADLSRHGAAADSGATTPNPTDAAVLDARATRRRSSPRRRPRRPGRLSFNTEPRWSTVWIGGRRRGNTPLHITLPAGRHRVTARPLGKGKRYTVTIRIAPGKTTRRVLTVR